jgi:ribosomal protein S27AE
MKAERKELIRMAKAVGINPDNLKRLRRHTVIDMIIDAVDDNKEYPKYFMDWAETLSNKELGLPEETHYVCPKCGPTPRIHILVNTWINAGILESGMEGAELKGDVEWCGYDNAQCPKCGYLALVKLFEK